MTSHHTTISAVSSGVTAVVHVAHAGLVIGGAALVLAMLSPLAIRRRRAALAELREAAASGNLVRLAELKAAGHEHTDSADRRPALLLAVVGSIIAAGVHVAVCPEHFREALRFGIFFVLISLFQTAWSVAVVRRPTRMLLLAGVAVNAGCVVLWAITRTVGLPFGLSEVEAVGVVDLVASVAEVATVIGCAACLGWAMSLRPHAVVSSGGA